MTALFRYSRRDDKREKAGLPTKVEFSQGGEISATLHVSHQAPLTYDAAHIAAALIVFCERQKIPLPKRAEKSIYFQGNNVMLTFKSGDDPRSNCRCERPPWSCLRGFISQIPRQMRQGLTWQRSSQSVHKVANRNGDSFSRLDILIALNLWASTIIRDSIATLFLGMITLVGVLHSSPNTGARWQLWARSFFTSLREERR